MDARESGRRFSRIERYAAVLFGLVIAAGLWQGYGAWLLGGNDVG